MHIILLNLLKEVCQHKYPPIFRIRKRVVTCRALFIYFIFYFFQKEHN